ncbi:MAG: hypothetical protein ACE5Z5_08035 [Candidatus Bathyarchaeia archaeon]
MILAQFKQGNPIPVYPDPTYLAIRGRVTGRAGQNFRTNVYDVFGRVVATLLSVVGITDPYDFEDLDGSAYTAVVGAGEGMYMWVAEVVDATTGEVLDQLSLQFVASTNVADIPVGEVPEKCEVNVLDKDTGLSCLYQAPAGPRIAFGKFVTSLYKFDPEVKRAFMRYFYGAEPSITDLGWITRAIITLDYEFIDEERMLAYLLNTSLRHTAIPDDIYDLVSRPDVTTSTKINALMPYAQVGIQHFMQGRVLAMRRVAGSQALSVDVYYRAGFLNVDWPKLIGLAVAGAVIVGAAVLAVNTFGAGLPLASWMAMGALAGVAGYFTTAESVSQPPTEEEKARVEEKAEAGKETIDEQTDQSKATVDALVGEGKVTPEAGERIKSDIERIRVTAKMVVDELVDEAKRQIDSAYRRGMLTGGAIGAVGGGAVGGALGYVLRGR